MAGNVRPIVNRGSARPGVGRPPSLGVFPSLYVTDGADDEDWAASREEQCGLCLISSVIRDTSWTLNASDYKTRTGGVYEKDCLRGCHHE
jgi:hypothetical protein